MLAADKQAVRETVAAVSKRWEIKDLRPVAHILGLQVTRDLEKWILHIKQSSYIKTKIE
jgi:hypothetical protein